jgi:MFS family permease
MNNRKQIGLVLIWRLIFGIVGGGPLALIPAYAAQFGAQADLIGYYLAFAFSSVAVSTFVAGWLADRFQRRRPFLIAASVALAGGALWMGWVGDLRLLIVVMALWFFAGGVGLTMIAILTGLLAGESERGRVFGIFEVSVSLGALIAGVTLGAVADRWGYRALFTALAGLGCLLPLIAWWMRDQSTTPAARMEQPGTGGVHRLAGVVIILLAARWLAAIAGYATQFATPVMMNALLLSATAVSLTSAVGGLISLPLPPLIGWMSDRLGRKPLLIGLMLVGAAGAALLAGSALDWQFWAVTGVLYIFQIAGRAVGSAFLADSVPPESLGRGLSFYGMMEWIGGIIGYGATGYAIQNLGAPTTLYIVAALPLLAAVMLSPIRSKQTKLATA